MIKRRTIVGIHLCLIWLCIFGLVLAKILPGRKLVVIDPGHGGIDGGTSSGGILEKDINLRMGHILRQVLEAHHYQVVMTRTDDSDVTALMPPGGSRYQRDLRGRVRLATRVRPCSLLSIHVNWHRDSWRRGAIVYYQEGESGSRLLAQSIQRELNALQDTGRQAQPANFYILRNTDVPGVIVELGFISNPEDLRDMQDQEWLAQQAEAIMVGLEIFLQQNEGSPNKESGRGENPALEPGLGRQTCVTDFPEYRRPRSQASLLGGDRGMIGKGAGHILSMLDLPAARLVMCPA